MMVILGNHTDAAAQQTKQVNTSQADTLNSLPLTEKITVTST